MVSKEAKEVREALRYYANIENAFKSFGKEIYRCWKDKKPHNFNALFDEFDKELTKLKETRI